MHQTSRDVLEAAYQKFLNGWATGDWQPFLDELSEDLIFQYPAGTFRGRHLAPDGKPAMVAWANGHKEAGDRIQITPSLSIFQDDWGIFAANSTGTYNGEPYDGNEAYFLRAQGDQIVEYREYIGDIVGWLSDIQ
ncbi:MAG: nuclear transport factor 2 family protein [Cyanobacteria bacterium RM1_2_2]|nr:nuclear transport factor 2 family protein [Cyanobacteria bacterium RM1_2_2]